MELYCPPTDSYKDRTTCAIRQSSNPHDDYRVAGRLRWLFYFKLTDAIHFVEFISTRRLRVSYAHANTRSHRVAVDRMVFPNYR